MTLEEMNRRHRRRYSVELAEDEEFDQATADAYFAELRAREALRASQRPRRVHFVLHDTIANTRDIRSLQIQTGRKFDTRCELNAYLTQTEMRCTEKGDEQDKRSRELAEWLDSGSTDEARGPEPECLKQRWATKDYKPPKADIVKLYRQKQKELS